MQTYYFHLRRNDELSIDHDGSEFNSVEAAYLGAFKAAQEMWGDCAHRRIDPSNWQFEVTDKNRVRLFVLPFREILKSSESRTKPVAAPEVQMMKILTQQKRVQRVTAELLEQTQKSKEELLRTKDLLAHLDI